jgi:hypothetical protein
MVLLLVLLLLFILPTVIFWINFRLLQRKSRLSGQWCLVGAFLTGICATGAEYLFLPAGFRLARIGGTKRTAAIAGPRAAQGIQKSEWPPVGFPRELKAGQRLPLCTLQTRNSAEPQLLGLLRSSQTGEQPSLRGLGFPKKTEQLLLSVLRSLQMGQRGLLGSLRTAQIAQRASLGTFWSLQYRQQHLLGLFWKPQNAEQQLLGGF